MTIDADKLIKSIRRYPRPDALLSIIIALNLCLSFLVGTFSYILDKLNILQNTHNIVLYSTFILIVFIGANLLIIVIWFSSRITPVFDGCKIGILFAGHSDDECNDLVYKLYEKLKEELRKNNYDNIIEVKKLPENRKILNHDEANKILLESNASLVIHGYIYKGNIENETVEGFRNISFTLRHRSLMRHEVAPVMRDMAGAMAFRKFTAKDRNSFIEKDIIINNIADVSLFFIALALTLDGKVEQSSKILEDLLGKIKILRHDQHNINLKFFEASTRSCMLVAYDALFYNEYNKHLVSHITINDFNEIAEKCDQILEKIKATDKRYSSYYLRKAIIQFHFNQIARAKATIEKALEVAPRNDPAPHFSMAFLLMWEQNYAKALKEYIKASKCSVFDVKTVVDVITFMESILRSHPEKQQYVFAIGFINDHFYDKKIALIEYAKFINENNKLEFASLVNYASKRIKHLSI